MSFAWRVFMNLKAYIQYQKPNAHMLTALALPLLAGVWTFGWRVLLVALVCMAGCWACEYAFTRSHGKPVSMAALVSGLLLALILPPSIPLWMPLVGCVVSMVFAKMAFGGFGKNIFNPAMVGRCFLYICFPLAMTGSWREPLNEKPIVPGGFVAWTADTATGATMVRAVRVMNEKQRDAVSAVKDHSSLSQEAEAPPYHWLKRLAVGNVSGCMGETSAIAIVLAMVYLLWRKTIFWQLMVAPLIGTLLAILVEQAAGVLVLPLDFTLALRLLGGGTLFAVTFMTTEPITAPMNKTARWYYGILIGIFATVISTMSSFPAGWMFAILLGNTFGPIIEIAVTEWTAWRKGRAAS